MSDPLEQRIEAVVRELVGASPPPLPLSEVLESRGGHRQSGWVRSGLLPFTAGAAAIIAFGAIVLLVGRWAPSVPPDELPPPPTNEGTLDPELSAPGTSSTISTASTTTTSSTTSSTSITSATPRPAPSDVLTLREDGLEEVRFGDSFEQASARMIEVLGEPDDDTGWIPSGPEPFGVCPGDQVRGLRWSGLTVLFSDGQTSWASGGNGHLFHYMYSNISYRDTLGLETARGIGLDDTMQALEDAYGDRVSFFEDGPFGLSGFEIEVPPPGRLGGYFAEVQPVITDIKGGSGCGV